MTRGGDLIISANDIANGIVRAIGDKFGSDTEIFTEEIKQGLSPPCFSVRCVKSRTERFLGNRFKCQYDFVVCYFTENNSLYSESYDVCGGLFDALELISTDDNSLLRGTDMSYTVKDGVVSFSVRYTFFVYRTDGCEKMGECTHNLYAANKF